MVTGVVVSAVVAVALLRSGGDRERPAPAPQRVAVAEAALVGTAGTGGTALALPRMVDLRAPGAASRAAGWPRSWSR